MTAEPPAAPPTWPAAVDRLHALQHAAEALSLLAAAERTGLLERLAEPVDLEALAADLGLRPDRIAAALGVLEAHGVVVRGQDGWVLDEVWAPLALGRTPLRFGATLGMAQVQVRQAGSALDGGDDYWQLSPADRLVVARGISPNALAPSAALPLVGVMADLPGVREALEAGGRMLELGCGIASRLCLMLQAFPTSTAVGVELDADLAAAGQEQAREAGVADRLSYVVGDAAAYEPDAPFDLVGWSQFFFPEPTRAGALAVARRALRPDGWLTMPCLWDGSEPDRGTDEHRARASERLMLDLWRVPMRSPDELVAELEVAGFVDVHARPSGPVTLVRGRRPGD